MRDNLIDQDRSDFFRDVIGTLKSHEAVVTVIVEDTSYGTATGASSPEVDVTNMFLERAQMQMCSAKLDGLLVMDRPPGGRAEENRFLLSCLETIQSGTKYITPDRFAINVVSSQSDLVRLLQAADVVVGCVVAAVAGEQRYSRPLLDHIKPLFVSDKDRIGGVGLKIHPDVKYRNLYHWLLRDEYFVEWRSGTQLPMSGFLYAEDEGLKEASPF
jgi:hypothetical protein